MSHTDTTALVRQMRDALYAVAPHTDKLICYASTAREHPDNLIDGQVQAAIAAADQCLAQQPKNQCGETCERARLCAVCARGLDALRGQEPVTAQFRVDGCSTWHSFTVSDARRWLANPWAGIEEVRLLYAAPVAQAAPVEWTDAKLRGIASDYFPDSKDWPAAILGMRHLLMEQGRLPVKEN